MKFAEDYAPDDQPTFDCDVCSDTGRIFEPFEYRGRTLQQVKKCECLRRKVRARRLEAIPDAYKGITLDTLTSSPAHHPKQTEYVRLLKNNPVGKYVISGDFGTGKTHFFWALYSEAVKRDRRVWAGTARALIAEFQKAIEYSQNGERYALPITVEDLRQREISYSIFLDDLDKARATEYAAEQLFEIVDACYSFGHQLVVTTNLRIDELVEHFRGADKKKYSQDEGFGRFGGSIVRRLLDNAEEIEMF